jgi:IclR family acetate operon transcriptional repressor
MKEPQSSREIYLVKPVYKALEVLKYVAEARRELSLSELARQLGLHKTTLFRYLYTLSESGFIIHDPDTDLYRLGLTAWQLGQLAGAELRLREVALPYIIALRDRFDETVNLGVADDREIVYLEMAESHRALRMYSRLGSRDPLYSTSLGKAILAFSPEEQWGQLLPARLLPRTPKTITSLSVLREELALTRERGYSQDYGENEEGSWCIGAPIFDERGRVTASISVAAPAIRLNEVLAQEIAAAVIETASSISQQLGYRSPDSQTTTDHNGKRAISTP